MPKPLLIEIASDVICPWCYIGKRRLEKALASLKDEVEVRRVHIGGLEGVMRVVEDGLKGDERVIVLGVLKARPGSKVTPKAQEPAAAGR